MVRNFISRANITSYLKTFKYLTLAKQNFTFIERYCSTGFKLINIFLYTLNETCIGKLTTFNGVKLINRSFR